MGERMQVPKIDRHFHSVEFVKGHCCGQMGRHVDDNPRKGQVTVGLPGNQLQAIQAG